MFELAHRRTLRDLKSMLTEWQDAVPHRAIAFHKQRRSLQRRVLELLGSWWPFAGARETEGLRSDVEALAVLRPEVTRLALDATTSESRVQDLRSVAEALRHDSLANTVATWTQKWLADLGDLCTHVSEADLRHDRKVLTAVSSEEADAREFCDLLAEAKELLEKNASGHRGDPIRNAWDSWVARVQDQGPSAELRLEIRRVLEPFREVIRPSSPPARPKTPDTESSRASSTSDPASAGQSGVESGSGSRRRKGLAPAWSLEISHLFSEAHKWAPPPPGREAKALEELEYERKRLQDDEGPVEERSAVALRDKVTSFIDGLRCAADKEREERLVRLQVSYGRYRHVAGADKDLEAAIGQLTHLAVDSADHHKDWIRRHNEAVERLKDRATLALPALTDSLKESIEQLRAMLAEAAGQPMSTEQARERESIRTAVEHIENTCRLQSQDARALLDAFPSVEATEQRLETLREEARALLERLHHRVASVRARLEAIRAAAATAGLPEPSAPYTWRLHTIPAEGEPLDRSDVKLIAIETEVSEAESRFVASGVAQIEQLRRESHRMGELLRRIPVDGIHDTAPEVATSVTPTELAALIVEARRVHKELSDRVYRERNRLLDVATEALKSLQALRTSAIVTAEDRGEVDEVAGGLKVDAPEGDADPMAELGQLIDGVAAWRRLHDRLHRSELSARERVRVLRSRLRSLNDEGLADYFPRVTERCSALVEGLPWAWDDWEVVDAQLHEAERLLSGLELQGVRLAAAEVEAAYATLKKAAGRHQRGHVVQLLEQMAPFERDGRLPPLAIRRELRTLVGGLSRRA